MADFRTWRLELREDVAIIAKRSAGSSFTYSIVLVVRRDNVWQAIRTFDNAHEVNEHHDHRYVGSERQQPIISYGPETIAMGSTMVTLREQWADIVNEWDKSR
jgi:hypothetical protein